MKEREINQEKLKQANKVLDALEEKITVEELCKDFVHCSDVEIRDFKNRMVFKKSPETTVVVKDGNEPTKTGSFLGSRVWRS